MIDKPIVENLGCMKGPQPLHFYPQRRRVRREEKNSGAELALRKNFSFRSNFLAVSH